VRFYTQLLILENDLLSRRLEVKRLNFYSSFLRAKAATALARLNHRNSVCLSVRPSHGWIRQKRCKLGSPNFHCLVDS